MAGFQFRLLLWEGRSGREVEESDLRQLRPAPTTRPGQWVPFHQAAGVAAHVPQDKREARSRPSVGIWFCRVITEETAHLQ